MGLYSRQQLCCIGMCDSPRITQCTAHSISKQRYVSLKSSGLKLTSFFCLLCFSFLYFSDFSDKAGYLDICLIHPFPSLPLKLVRLICLPISNCNQMLFPLFIIFIFFFNFLFYQWTQSQISTSRFSLPSGSVCPALCRGRLHHPGSLLWPPVKQWEGGREVSWGNHFSSLSWLNQDSGFSSCWPTPSLPPQLSLGSGNIASSSCFFVSAASFCCWFV